MTRLISIPLLVLSIGACTAQDEPVNSPNPESATKVDEGDLAKSRTPTLSNAELRELTARVSPRVDRRGELRLADKRLYRPDAAPLLLERLESGDDSDDVKIAIIGALPATGGDYAAGLVRGFSSVRSVERRAARIEALRLANDSDAALEGLRLGLADDSPIVRKQAAYVVGRRADGAALATELVALLTDKSTEVQAVAAKSAGHLELEAAFDSLRPLLGSSSPDARIEALRALARIDSERASALSELASLRNDSDPRIAKVADKVASQLYR